jgi:hypothetical protein
MNWIRNEWLRLKARWYWYQVNPSTRRVALNTTPEVRRKIIAILDKRREAASRSRQP